MHFESATQSRIGVASEAHGLAHGAWVSAVGFWRGLRGPVVIEFVQVLEVGTTFDALRLLVGGALVAQLDAVEVLRLLVVAPHATKYYELVVADCACEVV